MFNSYLFTHLFINSLNLPFIYLSTNFTYSKKIPSYVDVSENHCFLFLKVVHFVPEPTAQAKNFLEQILTPCDAFRTQTFWLMVQAIQPTSESSTNH